MATARTQAERDAFQIQLDQAKDDKEEKEAQVATAEEETHKAVQEHAETSLGKAVKLQQEAVEAQKVEEAKQEAATKAQTLVKEAEENIQRLQQQMATAKTQAERDAIQIQLDQAK